MRTILAAILTGLLVQSTAPLRIVVIEGEGAVNIVQQKTAVRPLIEVRDHNNVPVAGVTVTFTIDGGQPAAFAGGVQTLTVTTNAAGQAAATGFNALGPGAIHVQVQAAYQGRIATAAISQTNVATAAAASQATTAGSAAGGGGGGVSGTTIGIIGAAVAGGAVAATQLTGSEDDGRSHNGITYSGPVSGQVVLTSRTSSITGTTTCSSTQTINGMLKITLKEGNATGTAETDGTRAEISFTQSPFCQALANPSVPFKYNGDVNGGPSNLSFSAESTGTSTSPATGTTTERVSFTGSFANGVITGTLTYTHTGHGTNVNNGISSTIDSDGTVSFPMTLRP